MLKLKVFRVRDYAVGVCYIRGISDLDANFGCQCVHRDAIFMSASKANFSLAVQLGSVDMHRIYIYNTKDKPYILKLNGFERFPSELFTSTIVMRDFMRDESQARCCQNGTEC